MEYKSKLSKEDAEILFSNFKDDFHLYEEKPTDIVYFNGKIPVTRKQREDRIKKIFDVKF